MMHAVLVRGEVWTVVDTLEEAEAAVNGISYLNRWWKQEGHKRIEIVGLGSYFMSSSNPLMREWVCTWVPGHMGWDCVPLAEGSLSEERVVRNNRDSQVTQVFAPSAILAIERSKFLLMENGKGDGSGAVEGDTDN